MRKFLVLLLAVLATACSSGKSSVPTPTVMKVIPTVTPTMVATATSTVVPLTMYNVYGEYYGIDFGFGSVSAELGAIESITGTKTFTEAKDLISQLADSTTVACDVEGRRTRISRGDLYFDLISASGDVMVPEPCFDQVRGKGIVYTKLPQDLVNELKQVPSVLDDGANMFRVVGDDGTIYGVLPYVERIPDQNQECWKESLRHLGWNGQDYFIFDQYDLPVESKANELQWRYADSGTATWGPTVPDFCGVGNLSHMEQPGLEVSRQNDAFQFNLDGFSFRVHTDPVTCTEYEWDQGFLVEAEFSDGWSPVAKIDESNLILVEKDEIMIFINMTKDGPIYFEAAGTGYSDLSNSAAVWLAPVKGSITSWVNVVENPLAYLRDGKVVEQSPVTQYREQAGG